MLHQITIFCTSLAVDLDEPFCQWTMSDASYSTIPASTFKARRDPVNDVSPPAPTFPMKRWADKEDTAHLLTHGGELPRHFYGDVTAHRPACE